MKSTLMFLLAFPILCSGQIKLSGIIKDNTEPVAFATVVVSDANNEYLQGVVTAEDGSFELSLEKGMYTLKISHINYTEITKEVNLEKDLVLEPIIVSSVATELTGATVTANKSVIRREIDKTVVNIEKSPLAQSGNIFDALKSAPGLVVRNESIAMLGKSGVRISVDGRMIELSGNELNDFLKSLSGSDVKEIEVISNPSAKYEAEGNSGIVNIVTKRIKKNSWSNTLSATHNQARFGWQNINNSFSYKKNKFSLLFSTAYNPGNMEIKQTVEPNYSQNPQKIESVQKRTLNTVSPRVLLDYAIDETSTIGVQYLGSFVRTRQLDDLETTIFNADGSINSFLLADDVKYDQDADNSSFNLYYAKKLDTLGRNITFNFDVLDYNGEIRNDVVSNRFDADLNFLNKQFANRGDALSQITNYSAKVDVVHPIGAMNLSYGANVSFSNTDYRLDNFNTITGVPVFDASRSNEFNFRENIQSVYVNNYRKINDKWEIQVGLRAEYTDTKGVSKEVDITEPIFVNDYFKIFPTFYLQHNKNENNVFSINYGRRINRPSYSQLNPARTFLSAQSSQQGNPFLLPSFSDNIEIRHSYKYNLTTTISLRHTSDAYSFFFDLDDATQQQTITYKNLYKQSAASIMVNYQLDLVPWWSAQPLVFYSYSKSEKLNSDDNVKLFNGGGFYGSINNQLTLNKAKTIFGEVNFWYDGAYDANIYSFGEAYSLDLAVSFKSLIKGMNLTLGAHDVFNSSPRTTTSVVNGVEHNFIAFPSNRYFRVALSYNFGNKDINTRGRNFGNEDVRNRSN